jgi:galactitol-specific phosphotransferase system IIB component
MKHRIAIEPELTPIKDYLTKKGYEVENINMHEQKSDTTGVYDAYIVNGIADNFLGMEDTRTSSVVINAEGLSPDKIYHQLKTQLKKH